MRYWLGVFAASALVLPGASHAQPAPEIAVLDPEINAILTKWMAENHVPGMVFGMVKDGRLVYVKGEGVQELAVKRPVMPDTLFRIASMTKAFTAMSILKLRDEGRLALDDPADRYVPELRGWTYPTSDSPRITIRDLLTHSAGFVTDDPWGDRQQVLSQTAFTALLRAGVPFTKAPEMRHEYANLGYAILGRVIANITKAPYRHFVEQRLLAPLGMSASGFDVFAHPKDKRAVGYRWENEAWAEEPTMKDGAFNSMGGLEVSATDYAKWLGFVLSAWPPRDGAEAGPVKRGTVRQAMRGVNNARIKSVNTAEALRAKGVLVKRVEPVSADLASFYNAAQSVWVAGTIDALQGRVAMNFAMDRTAANWAKVLAETKAKSGTCDTTAPVVAEGAMSGTFMWKCEKGRIAGTVILAPTKPIMLQSLSYAIERKD